MTQIDASQDLESKLAEDGILVSVAEVVYTTVEAYDCGNHNITPIPALCASTLIGIIIEPDEENDKVVWGQQIEGVLSVLETLSLCGDHNPPNLDIYFFVRHSANPEENVVGWHSNYEQALETYLSGIGGLELFEYGLEKQ